MLADFSERQRPLLPPAAAFLSISLFMLVLYLATVTTGLFEAHSGTAPSPRRSSTAYTDELRSITNRKLLEDDTGGVEPNRVAEDGCTKDDILVHQQPTEPMPDGIPTYTVNVMSTCSMRSRCSMGRIHLTCGWFSSARQINPAVLRRLRFNDCLLNDGRPLPGGFSLSFQYADSFPYKFSVTSAECIAP
ncbi:hypothetical protein AXF42_Ash020676 [Apostasia shenzhenica]|uniref:Protein TAPETUM DETERMINANT 1 n=1 Tax=Apostasia shenzhenica TaxID=1088818 RepID=A0A2H9ZW63_9ASPA|nr:hypothetical protein AXF42_Ash020676 [Apostasia shenzhenica]